MWSLLLLHPFWNLVLSCILLISAFPGADASDISIAVSNMTLTATKFTPEVLLTAPRRSPAIPNAKGTKALFTVTTYSFETHRKTSQIRLLDIESGQSTLLVDDLSASEPTWIGDDEFLYLKSGEKGNTTVLVDKIARPGSQAYEVTTIKARISNIKIKELTNGTVAFVCSASATPDGQLSNPATAKKPYSSAKVYTSLFVRHWDEWLGEDKNSLWYTALEKKNGRFTLTGHGLVNALAGSKLESPVPPFGGTGDFDISPTGLIFVAKDPELNPALYTKTDLYYVPLKTFTEEQPPSPQIVETPGLEGYTNSPVFSHCGRKVAFTRMRSKQYESDKPRLMLLPDIGDLSKTEEFFATDDGEGAWDYRPETILWSADDKSLYVTAEKNARVHLWEVPSNPADAKDTPSVIKTTDGSVNDIRLLGEADSSSKLLVSSTSLVDNSCYSIVDPSANTTDIVSSNSKQGKTFGLSRSSIGDITFKGAGDYDVHALVVRPSNFDEEKKYPLCFLIHGGPQGAWQDGWSNRWNPAVFAEQGYVVVSPNPTGSTGYGMALQNGIKGQWGGRPYEDLVKAFEHIEEKMPYVDTDRAVALGASYGGYMINWIQGHPLGRKFKALVCHDGVFSTLNQWGTEELFFPIHDFEGTIYDNRAGYEKWDPAQHVNEWATPQLLIHSELDYRLPITEGLAPFNILQSKGIPSKLVMFPDENHWVLKPENSLVWHEQVLAWINKYSGVEKETQEVKEIAVVEDKRQKPM
ncbi:Alpha/Beta hydrolase protein [Neurospora hispaniola]|uniref:Dipeptidyl-peptidase V n=1 Tax=Neurospora hispaniola TaxID=588809 RepID=A0AAJ0MTS8_9PEZI|nr:Alpha/Beta hydrolase protein [Neurospora hispaniola]